MARDGRRRDPLDPPAGDRPGRPGGGRPGHRRRGQRARARCRQGHRRQRREAGGHPGPEPLHPQRRARPRSWTATRTPRAGPAPRRPARRPRPPRPHPPRRRRRRARSPCRPSRSRSRPGSGSTSPGSTSAARAPRLQVQRFEARLGRLPGQRLGAAAASSTTYITTSRFGGEPVPGGRPGGRQAVQPGPRPDRLTGNQPGTRIPVRSSPVTRVELNRLKLFDTLGAVGPPRGTRRPEFDTSLIRQITRTSPTSEP